MPGSTCRVDLPVADGTASDTRDTVMSAQTIICQVISDSGLPDFPQFMQLCNLKHPGSTRFAVVELATARPAPVSCPKQFFNPPTTALRAQAYLEICILHHSGLFQLYRETPHFSFRLLHRIAIDGSRDRRGSRPWQLGLTLPHKRLGRWASSA